MAIRVHLLISCLWIAAIGSVGIPAAFGADTEEQRSKLDELSGSTQAAGQLYAQGEYAACAARIAEIQVELLELLKSGDPTIQRLAKPIFSRLQRAHGLLELEGAELEALPSWSEITRMQDAPKPAENLVSFQQDIAPLLISACGKCHIDQERGRFSLKSYASLMQGTRGARVVFEGDAKGSRLVNVIESGDMPRGGGRVASEDLNRLKRWIDEGARFDGPNPQAALTELVAPRSNSSENALTALAESLPPEESSSGEGVSFARDIAPILAENCNGCHIGGQRASGNLRMDTFAQLMRGGDSGELISGTNANASLLIKKLKGQVGQRMPAGGRSPLSDETISLFANWIREGAKFDGPTPDTNIDIVVNQAWAAEASHSELFEKRKNRSLAVWSRVLPNAEVQSASNEEILVLGNVSPDRLEATLTQAEQAVKLVAKTLRSPTKDALIKGGLTIFVLNSRYNYSEFGRMIENRELPKDWLGHWQANPLDVYAVLTLENELEEKQFDALLLQVITGAYLGSFDGVPTWFAEGVARNLVVANYRRADERLKRWQMELPAAIQKVDSARTLLTNRLDEEAAGLVGMAMANFMLDRANRPRFDRMLDLLRDGRNFEEAITFAFAPPEMLVKNWLGKN